MNTTNYLKLASAALWGKGQVPDKYYIGLSVTAPSEDGTGYSEPNDPSYGRIEILNNTANFTAPDDDAIVTNVNSISFAPTTVDGDPITHYLIFDSLTGGNLLMGNKLENTRAMEIDTIIYFPSGNIKLQVVDVTE